MNTHISGSSKIISERKECVRSAKEGEKKLLIDSFNPNIYKSICDGLVNISGDDVLVYSLG